jgi:hypothetical protein
MIKQKKYETRNQAEWRTFSKNMNDGNIAEAKKIIKEMKNNENKLAAKNWIKTREGKLKKTKESTARISFLNSSKFSRMIEKEIDFMAKDKGFISNSPF